MEGPPGTDTDNKGFWLLTALPLLTTTVAPLPDPAEAAETVAELVGPLMDVEEARAALAAATAAARSFILSRMPGVKVILGFWLGTKCVILTGFLPSSVKISVNWLMYRKAWGLVPKTKRHVDPFLSLSLKSLST